MDVPQYFPLFRSPFTNLGGHLFTQQSSKRCNDFEMRAVECLEAYGRQRSQVACRDYFDDYKECVFADKRVSRHYPLYFLLKRFVHNITFLCGEKKCLYVINTTVTVIYYASPPSVTREVAILFSSSPTNFQPW